MSDLDDQDNPQEHRFRKTFEAELTGGVIPDNGVEGPRAIKAERIMNGPLMVAAALTLPAFLGWIALCRRDERKRH